MLSRKFFPMADIHSHFSDGWLVVVNPNAGSQKGAKEWPHICRRLTDEGFKTECVFTERRGHAVELTQKGIDQGYRHIVVVGGDGTLNEVLNGIMIQRQVPATEITLGMIPVGTGNDWCRTFGIPFDYKGAIAVLKREKTVLQDVGKISYFNKEGQQLRYFMNIAGMGYDALVAKKTNLLKERGKGTPIAYMYYVFASLLQWQFIEAVIEVDNLQVFKGEIFSMNVGICKYNGGGMKQVPDAIPDDGLMDITLIKKAPKLLVIRYAHKLFDGTLTKLPFVNTYKGRSIRIRSVGKIYLEADGESLGHTPFVYEIIPLGLRVVTGLPD